MCAFWDCVNADCSECRSAKETALEPASDDKVEEPEEGDDDENEEEE